MIVWITHVKVGHHQTPYNKTPVHADGGFCLRVVRNNDRHYFRLKPLQTQFKTKKAFVIGWAFQPTNNAAGVDYLLMLNKIRRKGQNSG